MSENIKRIQRALMNKGFNPGVIDGIWGRNTIAAIKNFQHTQTLLVDGIVGPNTEAALFGAEAIPVHSASTLVLPWLEEAKSLLGTKEFSGASDNPIIMEWSDSLDIPYSGDDVPWCGLFVGHCIAVTLTEESLPGNPLGARQWTKFGKRIEPCLGAVMVFWRISEQSGKGHVGFYVGEDDSGYQILGGNQSNRVCLTWVHRDRFLQARWPVTAESLVNGLTLAKRRDEGFSANES